MPEISIDRLEALSDRAEQIYNTMLAVESAMFRSDDSAENYGEAMRLLTDLMFEYSQSAKALFKEVDARKRAAA